MKDWVGICLSVSITFLAIGMYYLASASLEAQLIEVAWRSHEHEHEHAKYNEYYGSFEKLNDTINIESKIK